MLCYQKGLTLSTLVGCKYSKYAGFLLLTPASRKAQIWKAFDNVCISSPGAKMNIQLREKNNNGVPILTEKSVNCINLGSYNYLGFADDWASTCQDRVMETLHEFGSGCYASALEGGTTSVTRDLELAIASFVGKEDAVVFGQGYGTNQSAIPALLGKGSLIISDTLNHTSIVNGSRASGATIRVFRHNDVKNLEEVLKLAVVTGQPLTNRPWRKIIVMVEGIYSMEGELCELREVVDVAKKYKAYIYVDEAHSIGALGATGRGICESAGVDPSEIDILMGTFTKSFGAMGGYCAASKEIVNYLRVHSSGSFFTSGMSPVVAQQIITSLRIIKGEDGSDIGKTKLTDIRNNSNYLRRALVDMGCEVLGDDGSPVIIIMLYIPSKLAMFHQLCLERGLATVVVGFPACALNQTRARLCVSAAHSRKDMEYCVQQFKEVSSILQLKYCKRSFG